MPSVRSSSSSISPGARQTLEPCTSCARTSAVRSVRARRFAREDTENRSNRLRRAVHGRTRRWLNDGSGRYERSLLAPYEASCVLRRQVATGPVGLGLRMRRLQGVHLALRRSACSARLRSGMKPHHFARGSAGQGSSHLAAHVYWTKVQEARAQHKRRQTCLHGVPSRKVTRRKGTDVSWSMCNSIGPAGCPGDVR